MFAKRFQLIQNYLLSLYQARTLLYEFTKRDFQQRYKGSFLGVIWAMISPLLMLAVYSFIFVVVFKSRWENISEKSDLLYTLMIFSGLIPFTIFSESVNRSVSVLTQSANYIKKVVIKLEILPASIVLSTAINSSFSILLLVIGKIVFLDTPNGVLIFAPLVLFPTIILTLGVSLIVSALGIYLRDLVYIVGLIINILFYMSPIFYSTSLIPERFRVYLEINPLSPIIKMYRDIFINGQLFSLTSYFVTCIIAISFLIVGLTVFNFLRKGFSDVI
ncbi:ABC transporter permease [Paenibacillus sp. 2TAB26]|uniref:ABC transporter permease n=1 Tax=Paenibacillus sp. 2TAB26 TaxID=3233005 RepID=UPI003F958160